MSTDTVTQNETVLHDENNPTATTVETASASILTEPPAEPSAEPPTESSAEPSAESSAEPSTEPSSEIIENHIKSEGSSSNGINTNGPTNNTESTEILSTDQQNLNNDHEEIKSSSSNKNDLEPESFRKVFIGGLCYKTDDQTFRDYFSKFGEILDCIIMRDRDGRSRGFGFVTYASRIMVNRLMNSRPHNLDGREIEPKRAIPREESGKPASSMTVKKLFVGGIREGAINETDLANYFSTYGNIVETIIMKSQDGKSRGFGFVEFDDYDPVDVIVLEKLHTINNNPVNVEKALPKEQTNRARMNQQSYVPNGPTRGPPSGRSNTGGWAPMNNEPSFGGPSHSGNGYPPSGGHGGYNQGDYGNRPGNYGGGSGGSSYGSDMGSHNGPRGGAPSMMGYGGGSSGPINGGNYSGNGSVRGNYNDNFGAFGQPPSTSNFGQGYGSSNGGGPMRRGMAPGRGSGVPYSRGRGVAAPNFRGRN